MVRQFRRVVVTGFGALNPLGNGSFYSWNRLLAGESGIVTIPNPTLAKWNVPVRIAGMVPVGKGEGEYDEEKLAPATKQRDRMLGSLYATHVTQEALKIANWNPTSERDLERTGTAIGCGALDIGYLQDLGQHSRKSGLAKMSPFFIPKILLNMHVGHVAMQYKFKGPNRAVTTACATGVHNVGDAFRLVRSGDADVMISGGLESHGTSPEVMSLFSKIRAMSSSHNETPKEASRPFDVKRDGFVMGQGAAVLVLEELEHAKKRGAKIYSEILGYGLSADAHHVSAPAPDGNGAYRAMTACLRDGRIEPRRVEHVNCHATSTPLGDKVECQALGRLFGEHARNLRLSATKSSHGHLLGGTGALEILWTVLAAHEGRLPPILNLDKLDPEIAKLPNLPHFVAKKAEPWESTKRVALKNSFGFGGTNSCIAVSNYID